MTISKFTVGIAGAGIMGQLSAFALLNLGATVTLFEDNKNNNCSKAAAGLLTPLSELEKNDLIIFELGHASLNQYWPKILNKLNKKIYFKYSGSLLLSHPQDKSELTRLIQIISKKLNHSDYYQTLEHSELIKLEPDLTKFQEGYYFQQEGQIDNQQLLKVLAKYLIEKNITWHKKTFVHEVQPNKISTKDHSYYFDLVLDCRGLGAREIFSDLRSVRGELIYLHAKDVKIYHPIRFFHPKYSLYIVPRTNNRYLIGASEIESHDNSSISVRTTLELLTAAYYINPHFAEARIIKTLTQCRPTLKDHNPKIKYCPGFLAINGLYRHGFLIGPAIAEDIIRWVRSGVTEVKYPNIWERYT